MTSEEEYNREFGELIDTIRCPICSAPPRAIEGIAHLHDDGTVTEGSVVTCRGYEEHIYVMGQEVE